MAVAQAPQRNRVVPAGKQSPGGRSAAVSSILGHIHENLLLINVKRDGLDVTPRNQASRAPQIVQPVLVDDHCWVVVAPSLKCRPSQRSSYAECDECTTAAYRHNEAISGDQEENGIGTNKSNECSKWNGEDEGPAPSAQLKRSWVHDGVVVTANV